jgi:hypothetical protein
VTRDRLEFNQIGGCIFTASRYMAFPHTGAEFAALAVTASLTWSRRFFGFTANGLLRPTTS